MKSAPLRELVHWLEQAHVHGGPCGSAFELPVPPELTIKAEAALTWTLATGQPVELFTTTVSARALLAALVLRRSLVSFQRVFQNELDDDDFGRLTHCVAQIRRSGLELVEGPPPEAARGAAFLGG
jgi:hypothetical protein